MKCPYCDKEMDLGYIQSRDGVCWSPKKRVFALLSNFAKECVSLANGAEDSSACVYAYKCAECKIVIIDYSKR